MIYICIPAHNEEQTVGVVLWKIRQVMAEYPRDYQLLVVDDASTDRTPEVVAPYARVLPLTVVRTETRQGESAALEMMLRESVRRSEYPKRDMIVTLQADFTQEPDELVGLIKRMEAGADMVVGQTQSGSAVSAWARWARVLALRVLGRGRVPEGVTDPFTSYRAYRVAAVKAALAGRPGRLVHWDGWAGAAELLLVTSPHARRIDTVDLVERRERLQRPSRLRPWAALRAVWSLAREAKPLQVTSPAELDEAMRSIAAVRTSEVPTRGAARPERTQRTDRGRGTSEERRPPDRDRSRTEPTQRASASRESSEGQSPRGGRATRGGQGARGERSGAGGRPERKRPETSGAGPATPTRQRPEPRKAPAAKPLAAVAPEPDAAHENGTPPAEGGDKVRRKRPRRRKRPGGTATGTAINETASSSGDSPPEVTAGSLPPALDAVDRSVESAGDSPADVVANLPGADVGQEAGPAEAAAGQAEGNARRRRRGRRGGRRRGANGAAPAAGNENAAGEAADPGPIDGAGGGGNDGDAAEQMGIFELMEGERRDDA